VVGGAVGAGAAVGIIEGIDVVGAIVIAAVGAIVPIIAAVGAIEPAAVGAGVVIAAHVGLAVGGAVGGAAVGGGVGDMSQHCQVPQPALPHTVVATFAVIPVGHVIAPAAPWTMTIASIAIWFAERAIVEQMRAG